MSEIPLVRSIRRDLSRQLTSKINQSAEFPAVRIAVLFSLSTLWGRLESLRDMLRGELGLHPAQRLFEFYMKGGNAFDCVIDPNGAAVMQAGGGNSDWDTQIVIDPWAPLPLQNRIHGLIEDLILDELRRCAVDIAAWKPEIQSPDELLSQQSTLLYRYAVTRDSPQTVRRVYDRDMTGLWTNTQQRLSDASMPGAELPGMIFNDAIGPFILLRLGYTWHAKPEAWPDPMPPGHATGPEIDRPLLMELIDVTLPRLHTVEAVKRWEELQSGHLTIDPVAVSLQYQGTATKQQLPLPSLAYHFDEQVLMLCEVAAGVSKSADKVAKRIERLARIFNAGTGAQQGVYVSKMAAMAGVPVADLQKRPPVVTAIDALLVRHGAVASLAEPAGTPQYLAINMMYRVAGRAIAYDGNRSRHGRTALNRMLESIDPPQMIGGFARTNFIDAGASDDQALYSTVVRNGYLATDTFPGSGIDMAAWLRVRDAARLEDIATQLRDVLPALLMDRTFWSLERAGPDVRRWIEDMFIGHQIRVVLREHRTLRWPNTSLEQTLVIFSDARPIACITLTSATAMQSPFTPDPLMPGVNLVSVSDMAEQRRVAASVIDDFQTCNALSQQIAMLGWLFPKH